MSGAKKHTLRKIFLFDHMPMNTIGEIDGQCSWQCAGAGNELVQFGDTTRDVFFLVSGEAQVLVYSSAGKLMPLRQLKAGDFFGEMSAIDGQPRSASVEAVRECVVARMTPTVFQTILERDARVSRKLMNHFVQQIRQLTSQVYELGTQPLESRISAEVLRLAEDRVAASADGAIIRIQSKTQLAQRLGASREAVSREFKRLVEIGALAKLDSRSYRCNESRLRDIIDRGATRKS